LCHSRCARRAYGRIADIGGSAIAARAGLEATAGGGQAGLVERGGGAGVDVGAWNHAEVAEQLLLARGEAGVGQVERDSDGQRLCA
jgi:photosystem II stability/assembly factor-like uncharacterized protein